MPKISIKEFRGIRPAIDASALAGNEAQTANNCKVRNKALTALSGDLPSVPTYGFSFTDGFGTWTHATDGALKLEGATVNQTAPSAPTISVVNSYTNVSVSITTTVTLETDQTITTAPVVGQVDYIETGTAISGSYETQASYITDMESADKSTAIKGFSKNISVSIGSSTMTQVGQTADLAVAGVVVGKARLTMLTSTPSSAGWSWDKDAGKYYMQVSRFKVSFALAIEYSSSMGIERAVVYRVTNVESSGIETPASVASAITTLTPKQYAKINLSGNKTKRIYRAAGTALNAEYYFVAEVGSSVTTYNDFISDADLGEVMPDIENPPTTMAQVVWMPGGFLAGFNGKDIYFSDPFMLYSWNSDYTLTSQYTIIGLGVSGNDLIVLTNNRHYIITGTTPDVMTMTELMVTQPCESRLSICKIGAHVGFVSMEGFVLIQGGHGKVITEPFYSRAQWSALLPTDKTTIAATEYDNQLIVFMTSSSGVILDYNNGNVTTFSSSGSGSFTWKSKVFSSDLPIEMHVVKVTGASGNILVALYADGVFAYSGTATSNTDLAITQGVVAGKNWEVQISGTTLVDGLEIIHRERIVVNGPIRVTQAQTEGSWRRLLFHFPNRGRFHVARFRASAYPVTAVFYRDTTTDTTNTIGNDTDIRLLSYYDNDMWEVDVTATGELYELVLIPRQLQDAKSAVVHIRNDGVQGTITTLARIIEFQREDFFTCARVHSSAYPVIIRLYRDGGKNPIFTASVTNDTGFRLPKLQPSRMWEVDAISSTGAIYSVSLAKSMMALRG